MSTTTTKVQGDEELVRVLTARKEQHLVLKPTAPGCITHELSITSHDFDLVKAHSTHLLSVSRVNTRCCVYLWGLAGKSWRGKGTDPAPLRHPC